MKLDKSVIGGIVDSVLAILLFVVGKYLVKDAELLGLLKTLFLAVQPIVVIYLSKVVGLENARDARLRGYR